MLRISDVLIRNIIGIAQAHDITNPVRKTTRHIDMIVESIRSCGITFHVKT